MKGTLKIISESENYSEEIISPAEILFSGKGVRAAYSFEGDKCLLSVGGSVKYTRRGKVCCDFEFRAGKSTACSMESGGMRTDFTAETQRLSYTPSDGGFELKIKYKSKFNGAVRLEIFADCTEENNED